jgi:pimeloyl-ACP methyl ester carboxylesterase
LSVVKNIMRPLAAGAGLTGAIAAFNRSVRKGPLPTNELGGDEREWAWRGHRIFATQTGSGSPVLLVHGIYGGASSYEYRKLFPLLGEHHRVTAFDMLGCGRSDRPNIRYSADLYTDLIVDALAEFGGGEPVTLIGSSIGAAFAIRAAAQTKQRVSHLVVVCPTGLGGILDRPPNGAQRFVAGLIRTPVLGEALFNALGSRPSIRYFLAQTYADAADATPEVVDHYYSVAHQAGARFAPGSFVGGLLNCNVARDLPFVEAPVLVCWGERASRFSPLANAGEFVKLAQHGKLATFAASGMLPHEEEPAAAARAIEAFLEPVPA